jgi:hypothetical protein
MLKYSSRSVEDEYDVPAPEDDTFKAHDEAVYSTWQHYVDFCITSASSHRLAAMSTSSSKASSSGLKSPLYKYSHRVGVRDPLHHQKFDDVNRYISKSRLSTFQTMSRGDSLEPGSERDLSLPFEQVAIVTSPTPVMQEEMVSAPLQPSSRGLFPSPSFIEQAVAAASGVVHQSKPIAMVRQQQQQHFPRHPLAPPTAPPPGMFFGGPMPQPMMVQQLQHPPDMMLPPPGLVVAMVPPMPMRFALPTGSQEPLAVAHESTYSYNGLMEPQALFPPVPPAHHQQQQYAEAEVEAEMYSSHLSDSLEHSNLRLDYPADLACESGELDTKSLSAQFILEGTESPSSLRSSTNVSPRYLPKQQPHHRHQADADASDSLLFECSRDNFDAFKEFELDQHHNQQQHTALDDEHACIGLTSDSLLDHNRLSGEKSFTIPLHDFTVDSACSYDNDRDEQIDDGDNFRNPVASACTSTFSTPSRGSDDACTDSELATPLSSLRDRSDSSCSKDSMFPAAFSTISTSSTGTTASGFSSICPPSKVTFTSPRLVTAARPGNFPGMSFLGAPEVATTSTTSNAITSDAEFFSHTKDDLSQTAIFSSEGGASSFTEVTMVDRKLPEFSASPRLPGSSCHNVGIKIGDNHVDNEASLKKTYLLRSSAEAAVRHALLSPLPLGSIDNPSVTIFSPREEQLSGDESVKSSTDSVSLFLPEENESENFIPIVCGPPSLAQHSKVPSPVIEIGYDLVGSRDGSSSYRAFLTPSPTTFESAIELGPPILERESMVSGPNSSLPLTLIRQYSFATITIISDSVAAPNKRANESRVSG